MKPQKSTTGVTEKKDVRFYESSEHREGGKQLSHNLRIFEFFLRLLSGSFLTTRRGNRGEWLWKINW